ncbi:MULTISPECIES: PAS domain-containing hybrid sensor histidine kinase/response regulator [unclassified Pseudomonas]|uniref:PAS domain-containing hybrid sensor histidine kinase/response regulator n=1 Tax=unclassified Pseudomonas TaxID=196821 RepID=UPI000BD3F3E2|nr:MULTISPECIES: PAS domain-containing hybrid sensor histidine kinase/response regulator [unclassified Pseudomonas]PVZ13681.1 PAS domain S-box-containing protein [Pseudomonas sp. URIL14HWK12:I12]PVZ23987.1 PAS domain S-box-containing protein [Pseudomonas sp. URIL14HWK12:I10]PVZ33374.1 PAS domain S-box-containing protein [Pseudomonas sp. URIL14HWK12:I11]SNZ11330.1 PAS domain S-box-containing protein [Pseudomonas sp. URIL14HWK12:I9]
MNDPQAAAALQACLAALAQVSGDALGTWDWDIRDDVFTADAPFALMHHVAGQGRPIGAYVNAVHPDDRGRVAQRIKACLHGDGLFAEQYRLRGDNGWRWVYACGRGLRDSHGRPARFIGASLDITERRRQEQALQALTETLELKVAERTQALAEAHERLVVETQARAQSEEALRHAQKMEAVGQLTGGIAHDFNNMLTGVIGSLELLKRYLAAGRTEDTARLLDAASTSAQRAAELTHRLLAFSRRQPLNRTSVDVAARVDSLRDLISRTTGERIRVNLAIAEGTWPVETDASQLESALLNLVINARDAMPDGGELTLGCENLTLDRSRPNLPMELIGPGDYVVLSVADTGSGMTEAVRVKAFDPFFTTKPTGQGTGLGLSMIYGFAQQSGGHVALQSSPGQGTRVSLYLPRHQAPMQAPQAAEPLPAPLAVAGETVLVVEDDPAVRVLILNLLDELGYQSQATADAESALPLLASRLRIDLLITDVGLPGTNGRQLAEIARQRRPGLKVLFMTGYAEKAAQREEIRAQGMDIVGKPFTLDELAVRVRGMLGDRR